MLSDRRAAIFALFREGSVLFFESVSLYIDWYGECVGIFPDLATAVNEAMLQSRSLLKEIAMRAKSVRSAFGRAGMRVALLGLSTGVLGVVPMIAQDNSTPSTPPAAQGGGGGHMGGRMGGRGGQGRMQERQLEMMTKELNLTPDQVTQVKAINADSEKQMLALRDDTAIAPADKRTKMMAIRQASMAKVRASLTDEQKTKMDAMMAKMRERREDRAAPPPPPQG